ncbi:MAG: ATP-binding protein [Bacteroidales bacterium]|nr:ATP-binding protein [Bacteroidales bacterium]
MNEEEVKSHTSDLDDEISTRKLSEEKFVNLYENVPDMFFPVDFIKVVMDNLPIGLAVNSVDPLVKFNYMNDNFPSLYRTTREALAIEDNFWNAVYEDPVFREEMRKRVLDDIASGKPERMHWEDIPITRKGEKTTYINASNIQVTGKSLMISTVWDITDRKQSELLILESQKRLKEALDVSNRSRQTLLSVLEDQKEAKNEVQKLNAELEQRVIERTLQLQAINKELETFTYSVSHDLKAPLRGIDGYSKLLSDLYKSSLNEEAQLFIETIRSSTLQMNQLIDDLLDYSRLERSQLSIEPIRIKELIHSVLDLYMNELETGRFGIDMNIPDIELVADRKGLTIALRNLLENAIKFSKGKSDPSIQIKVEDNEFSWIISVKDNGIGFDMKYHQKIFEIFQRLQRVEDFPGTGIGLAMVNKAMQRMCGRTWADSTPGMGSTFYLEIPKNK